MSLPEGAKFAPGAIASVEKALEVLALKPGDKDYDAHAPRRISVDVVLHVHQEYPKHVTVGKDDDDKPIVKIVYSEAEEKAVIAASKPKRAAKPAAETVNQ